MELLVQAASFVPRVINILADKSLLVAYGEGAIQVTDDHVTVAIDDSRTIARPVFARRPWMRRALMAIIAAEIAAIVALSTFNPNLKAWTQEHFGGVTGLFGAQALGPDANSAPPVPTKTPTTAAAEPARVQ
jgi:hypothetical protein